MSSEELKEDLDQTKEVVDEEIDKYIDFDQVRAEGISIRVGGRKMKLFVDEEQDVPEIEEIRNDLREKFNNKLNSIKEWLNEQISGMYSTFEGHKQAVEEERKKLERARIDAETDKMPQITKELADQGLSVAKGEDPGSLVWLYRDFYWPKFIDSQVIEVEFSKELITPIVIEIVTKDYRIMSCRVVKFFNLEKFDHYHATGSNECWGTWSPQGSWENPEDILVVAQRASQLLTEINSSSPGNDNPRNLPQINTMKEHIKNDSEEKEKLKEMEEKLQRSGEMSRNVANAETVENTEPGTTWSIG